MNKAAIVAQIIGQLDAELERAARAARDAQAGATDPQSKAENKYDTRGLEASYLAHGQSRQALETAHARQRLAGMELRDFAPEDAVDLGALIEVEGERERLWYLLLPAAGGREGTFGGAEIVVVTPVSPMGNQLMGKYVGDSVKGFRVIRVL